MNHNYFQHFEKLLQFNLWANKRISEMLIQLHEEKFSKEICSSFKSVKLTTLHIWDAETIWKLRLEGKTIENWPGKNFNGDKNDVITGLISSSQELLNFYLTNSEIDTIINYHNIKGENFFTSVKDIVTHVVNHSTFHRGQIITMLRQLGETKLSGTDYITYVRE